MFVFGVRWAPYLSPDSRDTRVCQSDVCVYDRVQWLLECQPGGSEKWLATGCSSGRGIIILPIASEPTVKTALSHVWCVSGVKLPEHEADHSQNAITHACSRSLPLTSTDRPSISSSSCVCLSKMEDTRSSKTAVVGCQVPPSQDRTSPWKQLKWFQALKLLSSSTKLIVSHLFKESLSSVEAEGSFSVHKSPSSA